MVDISTERLVLRDWQPADLAPWAALNADPAVREFLGPLLTAEQAGASMARFQAGIAGTGWGFWAVELTGSGEFIGCAGLDPVDSETPFSGVEIGWRLARTAWGYGYASEAARAVLRYGFDTLGLAEIFAITAVHNLRSQAVMHRIGMTHQPSADFDDPAAPADDPLRRQVVYRIEWPARVGTPVPDPS